MVAEVWRGGSPGARLARLLSLCRVDVLDVAIARRAGELLASTGGDATLDAVVVACAALRGDLVLTSDPGDLAPLAAAAGVRVAVL